MTASSSRSHRVLNLLLAVFGLTLGLLIAEIGARLAGIKPLEVRCYDAARGWKLKPGAIGTQRSEGGSEVRINSGGFRGPEVPVSRPPGTLRVAILGDSFTEAMHVPYEQSFSAVVERELARCDRAAGKKAEVLDFGVSGYGTGQELLTLRFQASRYSPDIVVLAFFAGNDVSDNVAALDSGSWVNGELCRPHFEMRGGSPAETDRFRDSLPANLWCRTIFTFNQVAILDYLEGPVSMISGAYDSLHSKDASITGHEPGIDDQIYGPPPSRSWNDAWQVTEQLIAEMNREVKASGARLLVVTLSTPIQVYPDPAYRETYLKAVGGTDLFYPEHRIAALGEREGIAVLNLAPQLQAYADEHHAFLHGFANTRMGTGHWNALGHRIAGESIARRLCGMVESKPGPQGMRPGSASGVALR